MPSIDVAQQTTLESALEKAQNMTTGVSYTNTIISHAGNASESNPIKVTGKGFAHFTASGVNTTLGVKVDGAENYITIRFKEQQVDFCFNKSIEFYGYVAYVVQTI